MMAFLARVLLQIFVFERVLLSALCSGNCSCYTFHDVKKNWEASNMDCKSRKGVLVSMETIDEWKFINTEIQKRNTSVEWYIGLKIQAQKLIDQSYIEGKRKADWEWTSGLTYTLYNQWQPYKPNGDAVDQINTYFCGVMAKKWPLNTQGLLKDVNCDIRTYPYICEYGEGIAVNQTLRPVCWNKYTKTRSPTCVQATTTTAATTLPVTTNVVTNSLIPTINNVPVTVTKTTIKIASTPVYETPTSRQSTPNLSAANTQDTFDTVLIIVIVLAIALVVLICGFIVVYCKKRKKSGKSSSTEKRRSSRDNQSTNITTQETNLSIPTTSNGIQTTGGDLVIYAEVSSVATDPNPTYNEVQGYLSPVDAHVPSPPTDYYSNVDETLSKQRNNALNPLNTEIDGENEDIGTCESLTVGVSAAKAPPAVYAVVDKSKKTRDKRAGVGIATKGDVNKNDANNLSTATPAVYAVVDKSKKTKEKKAGVGIATKGDVNKNDATNSSSAMPAVYAVVDKSKKTKEKKAAVGIATEKNKAKDDASTYESEISSGATPAIYAVVNKSTKEKKAGVGIATMEENKKERVDADQHSTYENTRKDNETYEHISRDLYSGLSYDKRQPEENCDHSGPEVPLYSSVDSG